MTKYVENLVGTHQTNQLEEKIRALNEYIQEQTSEACIQVRIQQLALSKVLVNIHKRNQFILVKAYCNLG
jgi:hypothetical protein